MAQPDLVHDAGERFLTRIDVVLRAASLAALFADTMGGGADEDGGRRLQAERRAAAQIEMEAKSRPEGAISMASLSATCSMAGA